ncbi:MAG: hypothetical protein VX454_13595 [Pseudomonadota bacterium]|nr:hypothetical protein [Pseudomonadota bacterium]
MRNRDPGRASSAPPRREGGDRDWSVVVEDGRAKTNEPVSSAVAEPESTTLRHEPHEPPRQHLPNKLFEKRTKVHNKRIDGPFRRFKLRDWVFNVQYIAIRYTLPAPPCFNFTVCQQGRVRFAVMDDRRYIAIQQKR